MRRFAARLRRHVTYANIMSTFAAFVALTAGTAFAATVIEGRNLRNESVTGAKIKNGSLAAGDLSSTARATLKGQRGPAGAGGSNGANGSAGAPGAKGDTGATGAAGPQGATGAQGPKGDAGDTGPTGAQGPTGPQGATGPQGPAGTMPAPEAWQSTSDQIDPCVDASVGVASVYCHTATTDGAVRYYKDASCRVYVRGEVTRSTGLPNSTAVITLPVNYRPQYVHTESAAQRTTNDYQYKLSVQPTGELRIAGPTQVARIYLDEVSFRAEPC